MRAKGRKVDDRSGHGMQLAYKAPIIASLVWFSFWISVVLIGSFVAMPPNPNYAQEAYISIDRSNRNLIDQCLSPA